MKLAKFHSPYAPNDGHGPGVPLPPSMHTYLMGLNGRELEVQTVLDDLRAWDRYLAKDMGGYIGITHSPQGSDAYPRHHWLGIKYELVQETQ